MNTKDLQIIKPDSSLDGISKIVNNTVAYKRDDKGNVLTELGEDGGRPLFEHSIVMPTDSPEVMAMWTTCKAILEERLVPQPEEDAVFKVMEMLAEQIKTDRAFSIKFPVNYFTGLWHCLNTARKFDIFNNDKKLSKSISNTTFKVAQLLDTYHVIKDKETGMDDIKRDEFTGKVDLLEDKSE